MKLKDLIKLGRNQNIEFSKLNIDKKIERKIDFISFICHLITFLPFILILINIYKFLSPIRIGFVIVGFTASLILVLLLILNSIIVSLLYKEYSKDCSIEVKDFFDKFNFKANFCYMLFNYLNLGIIVVVLILLIIFRMF